MLSKSVPSPRKASDDGFTLIEVIVAMFIFAIISLGVASALITTMRVTNDSVARQTASSLAASLIDQARTTTDLTTLNSSATPTNVTVGGRTYHVSTTVLWGSATGGSDAQCSSGSGALLNKAVKIQVTWDGMDPKGAPAEADTVVAPKSRISAIDKGVIIVSVKNAQGAGNPGVTISVIPSKTNPNGASAITAPIAPTDAQGCGYVLNVTPGTYTVSITKPGTSTPSVDIYQSTTPSQSVDVSAASTSPAPFQFDQSAVFTANYATNFVGSVLLPLTLDTSFVNTYGMYVTNSAGPYYLHPFSAGYTALAGSLGTSGGSASNCLSVDPGAWLTTKDASGTWSGIRPKGVAAPAGGPVTAPVPMGVATVTGSANGYIKAVAQTTGPAPSGNPGCAAPATYLFKLPATGVANLALPFGSWQLLSGTTSTTQATNVATTSVVLLTKATVVQVSGTAVVTFDPRTLVGP